MRIFFLLLICFALCNCNSKKNGPNDLNSGNPDYSLYDSSGGSDIFNDKTILTSMPGQFAFGVRNNKGKPYRYLVFKKSDTLMTLGKNYFDVSPGVAPPPSDSTYYPLPQKLFYYEYSIRDCFLKVVKLRYDTVDTIVHETQLLVALDRNSKDTILFQEEVFYINRIGKNLNVVGGTFAVFDKKSTLKDMKNLCDDALKTMKDEPK